MTKLTRAKAAGIILLASSAIFTLSSSNARASIFYTPFETIVLASMTTMQTMVLQLSTDIGSMADRILVMADKIGVMADRIVHTEQLMVSLVNQNGTSTLITSPADGTSVSKYVPIQLTLSNNPQSYILYISNKADMSGSTNALVVGGYTAAAWSRLPDFATSNTVYIAVKSADGLASSDLSNTVKVILN
jgi:hypothetical protein